jgi:hypothetical protein
MKKDSLEARYEQIIESAQRVLSENLKPNEYQRHRLSNLREFDWAVEDTTSKGSIIVSRFDHSKNILVYGIVDLKGVFTRLKSNEDPYNF